MLETNQIHNGAQLHDEFCEYAGVTFVVDPNCDQYTGTTGVTFYDNPIVKGCVRWEYVAHHGHMVTVRCWNVPDYENSLHKQLLEGTFNLPDKYKKGRYIYKYDFEDWINDELLKLLDKSEES